ncbi:hypothetical protein D3C78_1665680 [compost metagenome]
MLGKGHNAETYWSRAYNEHRLASLKPRAANGMGSDAERLQYGRLIQRQPVRNEQM